MKRTLPVAIAIVLTLSLYGVASAAFYSGECWEAACSPFWTTNTYVQQKAVNIAASNNAAVGDIISLSGDFYGDCRYTEYRWRVNQVPTLDYTHLTYVQGWCIVRDQ